jgi:hypothetical protein
MSARLAIEASISPVTFTIWKFRPPMRQAIEINDYFG